MILHSDIYITDHNSSKTSYKVPMNMTLGGSPQHAALGRLRTTGLEEPLPTLTQTAVAVTVKGGDVFCRGGNVVASSCFHNTIFLRNTYHVEALSPLKPRVRDKSHLALK